VYIARILRSKRSGNIRDIEEHFERKREVKGRKKEK